MTYWKALIFASLFVCVVFGFGKLVDWFNTVPDWVETLFGAVMLILGVAFVIWATSNTILQ